MTILDVLRRPYDAGVNRLYDQVDSGIDHIYERFDGIGLAYTRRPTDEILASARAELERAKHTGEPPSHENLLAALGVTDHSDPATVERLGKKLEVAANFLRRLPEAPKSRQSF